jgi:histone H3/H4
MSSPVPANPIPEAPAAPPESAAGAPPPEEAVASSSTPADADADAAPAAPTPDSSAAKSSAAAAAPPKHATRSAQPGAGTIEFEPPLACVRRLLKHALPSSTNVGKDASSVFTRACGIFVIYLTACANDCAREKKRQTITANDVLEAAAVSRPSR